MEWNNFSLKLNSATWWKCDCCLLVFYLQCARAVLWGSCTTALRRGSESEFTLGPLKDWGACAPASSWRSTSSGTWWAETRPLAGLFTFYIHTRCSFIAGCCVSVAGHGGCRWDVQRASTWRGAVPWESPHRFTGIGLIFLFFLKLKMCKNLLSEPHFESLELCSLLKEHKKFHSVVVVQIKGNYLMWFRTWLKKIQLCLIKMENWCRWTLKNKRNINDKIFVKRKMLGTTQRILV